MNGESEREHRAFFGVKKTDGEVNDGRRFGDLKI